MSQPPARRVLSVSVAACLAVGVVADARSAGPGSASAGTVTTRTHVDRNAPADRVVPSIPGELLVRFRADADPAVEQRLRARFAPRTASRFRAGGEHWILPQGISSTQAIAELRSSGLVVYAEPNYLLSAQRTPDDPHYGQLWGLNNTGQTGGTPGADIRAERAWDVTTGSADVLVAVIDSGVDASHPDLAENIWTNPGEVPGNAVDDDGNGYVDDVHGWDFVNDDNDPFDDNGHGTHVAGTIGALGNNAVGVAGVAWRVSILPLKFLGSGGSGSTSDAILAVEYATAAGVDLTSNSWGGGAFSQPLLDAIVAGGEADVLFVAAAGNYGENTDVYPMYPAAYDADCILSVAATDAWDNLASFSNYGAISVDLAAPGVDTLSSLPGGGYGYKSGTSMATPHVSGAAALLRSLNPSMGVAFLKERLMTTATPIPALAGLVASGGRLDAFLAVEGPDDVAPGSIDDLAVESTATTSVALVWTATGDDGTEGTATTYDVRYATEPLTPETIDAAPRWTATPQPSAAGGTDRVTVSGLRARTTYHFAVRAKDEWGNAGALGATVSTTTLPGTPELNLFGTRREVISEAAYFGSGAMTTHLLVPPSAVAGEGTFTLVADGDYGDSSEIATATAEGLPIGQVGEVGSDCQRAQGSFSVSPSDLATLAADGTISVQVQNSAYVDAICSPNRHIVTLAYSEDATRLDYGTVFVGARPVRTVRISNIGDDVLEITSVAADDAAFVPAATSMSVIAGATAPLDVVFAPGATGPFEGTLTLLTNDPDEGTVTIELVGEAIPAPALGLTPDSFAEALRSGESVTRTLTLSNTGGSDLEVRLAAQAVGTAGTTAQRPETQVEGLGGGSRLDFAAPGGGSGASEQPHGPGYADGSSPMRDAYPSADTPSAADVPNDMRILLLGSGSQLDEIRSLLLAFDDVAAVDILDAGYAVPTLEQLLAYRAVILANNRVYAAPDAVGDVLADYVDAGGAVVLTLASFVDGWAPTGRFVREGYSPALSAYGPSGSSPLGSFDAAHPIFEGVTALYGDLLADVQLAPEASLVGQWQDGKVLVATRGERVVLVNLFVAVPGYWSGDAPLILRNSAFWANPTLSWLRTDVEIATIPPGGSLDVAVTIDAADLFGGQYLAQIVVDSNDPLRARTLVPVALDVTGVPDIVLEGEPVESTSTIDYQTYEAATTHAFDVPEAPSGGANVRLRADGDFGAAGYEFATLSAEGSPLGTAGGAINDCQPALLSVDVGAQAFANLVADGVATFSVVNSPGVDLFCDVNRHEVVLTYRRRADRLEFGDLFVGLTTARELVLHNVGTQILHVTSIASDSGAFVATPAAVDLPPRSSVVIRVDFSPADATLFEGTLTFTSDDPDEPTVLVALRGTGLVPPELSWSPAALEADLTTNQRVELPLTIRNDGGSPLEYRLGIEARPAAQAPPEVAPPPPDAGNAASVPTASGPPAPAEAPAAAFPFEDDFEDGDAIGWFFTGRTQLQVTAATAGAGSLRSLRLYGGNGGHDSGVYQTFAGVRPRYVSFWVRPGAAGTATSYVVFEGEFGDLPLWFYASDNGRFIANDPTYGGDASVVYTPGTWYHVEFRNIDFTARTFDYWVNGASIKSGIPLQLGSAGSTIRRMDVYNFTQGGEAHWDEFVVSDTDVPAWISVGTGSGTVAPGGAVDVIVGLDAADLGTSTHRADLVLATNDPDEALVRIPVEMRVTGAPDIALVGEVSRTTAERPFSTYGAVSNLDLAVDARAWTSATLRVTAYGNFESYYEIASVTVEGTYLGDVGGTGTVTCASWSREFPIGPAQFEAWRSDGRIGVVVANSSNVSPSCADNRHAAELTLRNESGRIDFGGMFVGLTRSTTFEIRNVGTDPLSITSIGSGDASVTVSPTAATLARGESRTLTITWSPVAAGILDAAVTIVSDDPDEGTVGVTLAGEAIPPPDIEVDPASVDVSLMSGQAVNVPVTIRNVGASELAWSVSTGTGVGGSVVAVAPATSPAAAPAPKGDPSATAPPDPPGDRVATLEATEEPAAPAAASAGSLEEVLAALDASHASITARIPGRYDFSEGTTGSSIGDGGGDMYDGGNYLSTSAGGPIPYRDGTVTDSALLGPGGRYFTRKYPGLFVFVGEFEGPDQFTISGDLGADGSGLVNAAILRLDARGSTWRGYVKRVWAAYDPSVNHLVLVEGGEALPQDHSTYTNDDFHRIRSIPRGTRVHYLLFASGGGGYVGDADMLAILEAYVDALPGGSVSATPESGVVPAGGQAQVNLAFDATDLDGGVYASTLVVSSNDPDEPIVEVPLTFRVTGTPDIDVRRADRSATSGKNFLGYGAQTVHTFETPDAGNDAATVEVVVEGDFSDSWRTATVTADGTVLGTVSGAPYCGSARRRFTIDGPLFTQIAADGAVVVVVQNSGSVSPYCVTNRHTVTFTYRPPLDVLDFGELFLGRTATMPLVVANPGTDALTVSAIDSDVATVSATPSSLVVPKRSSGSVQVAFSPTEAGEVAGSLTIASNDPDEPVVVVPFRGSGIVPPDIGVAPASLDVALNSNETATRALEIANTGGSSLSWTLRLAASNPGTVLAAQAPAPPDPAPDAVETATSEPPADPPASRTATLEAPAGPAGAAEPPPSLERTLELLDVGHESITAAIPSRFDFGEGIVGSRIEDGGSNLFDGGNYLGTELGYPIGYSDGVVGESWMLGSPGRYFTRKYPGLFVFVGDVGAAREFRISGNLGANGYGQVSASILEYEEGGTLWRGYVKRVHGALTPSVNHLVIVGGGDRLIQDYSTWTDDDFHRVRFLAQGTRVHYLMFATLDGGLVDDAAMLAILRAYVGTLGSPVFSASPRSGSVPAGQTQTVDVGFDANGLDGGDYTARLEIASNDPDEPVVAVPMTLHVTGVPDILLRRPEARDTSTALFTTAAARTTHVFPVDPSAPEGGILDVTVQGDFYYSEDYATVLVEGLPLGTVKVPGYCGSATRRFPLDAATFAALAADGVVQVDVVNSPYVSVHCPVNSHAATLSHRPGLGTVDFGEVYVGTSASTTLQVGNTGTDLLDVSSVAAQHPDLTADPSAFTVPRRASADVVVRFAPTSAGVVDGSLAFTSNDPDEGVVLVPYHAIALVPPDIDVTPPRLDVALFTGARVERAIDVANTGESDLRFTVEVVPPAAASAVLEQQGPFDPSGREPAGKSLASPPFEAIAAGDLSTSESSASGGALAGAFTASLEEVRGAIERSSASVTDLIPNRYDFAEGEVGDRIADGGGDMYDGGNYLSSSSFAGIVYTNGPIVANGSFGAASRYFTRKLRGLFVLVADLDGIDRFTIDGDLGADGGGTADGSVLRLTQSGRSWLAFVKRVYGAGDPSVNHLVLVEESPGLQHVLSAYTNSDYHSVFGLTAATRLHYLLFAGSGGQYVDNATMGTIASRYLQLLPGSRIATPVTEGVVPAGGHAVIPVTFDGVAVGDYDLAVDVEIRSNDPDESVVRVPATLHVTAAPDLVVEGAEVSFESVETFDRSEATTLHRFEVPATTTGTIRVDATVTGDFDSYWDEFARIRAEDNLLGELGRGGPACAASRGEFTVRDELVPALVADGSVEIRVENSWGVDPSCPTNEHRVRLRYRQAGERTTFAPLFIGLSRGLPLRISNAGFASMHCTVAVNGADFATDVPSLSLAPGESAELLVRFTPLTDGPLSGLLTLSCDDPDEPAFTSALSGTGVIPPDVEVSPVAIEPTLVLGESSGHAVVVRNTGGSDLVFDGTATTTSAAAPSPSVLILADNPLPWGSDAIQRLLAAERLAYEVAAIGELPNLDLAAYRRVIVPSDQSQTFYHSIRTSMHLLEEYVDQGGVLEFHAAGWGSQGGNPTLVTLPGGAGIGQYFAQNNYVLRPDHPLAAGVSSPLRGDYASVAYFYSLPAQASVVLTADPGFSLPSLVVYPIGEGWVLAGSLTFEYGYDRGQAAGTVLANMIGWRIGRAAAWFSPTEVTRTVVPPGGEVTIDLGLDSSALDPGIYEAVLRLATNDPDETEVDVRTTLRVVRLLAVAGPDQTLECTAAGSAAALLDGAASRHMDGAEAIASYTWLWNETAIGEGALAIASLPLGANDVDLWITDALGDLSSDRTRVTVVDTTPPAGRLTSPSPGACFGPAALPVRLLDDVVDACAANLTRSYDVAGGPEYATHGDYDVGLLVSDPSGNVGDAGRVPFTIDTRAPQAAILVDPGAWTFPAAVPFQELFTDGDDDAALGDVVRERITIDGCTFYDGMTFGDRDGLLLDELLPIDTDAVCRLARMCGRTQWTNPVVAVEATDCGGNVTRVSFVKTGGFSATHCP
ncbi:MAG TPA: choice-of-anchor D domain-containing protein [Candidatus Polarisedimenticolaceae bacterium]